MRVVNRTAISLVGEAPFVEWMRANDADANKVHVDGCPGQALRGTVVMYCPSSSSKKTFRSGSKTTRRGCSSFSSTPGPMTSRRGRKTATWKTFKEWFRIDVHSVVVDAGDDDIEGEEL